jgi:GT2 family glycosyltransferase
LNGSRFLRPCLEALRATRLAPGASLEPIVVDNGSSDDTAALLARYPEVKALFFRRPLGFARANNAARTAATGEVVCFLNNDTQVEPGWAERPLEIFASDPQVAGVGSKLLFMNPYVPVRFRLPKGVRLRAQVVMFGSALEGKVRWSEDVRDGWLRDGSTVYLPMPAPQVDLPLPADPVIRLLEASGSLRGATVAVGTRSPHAIERLPGLVAADGGAGTLRLIQNAGNFVNERCEGGDVGAGEEDTPDRYDAEEIVPAICGAALWARRDALEAAGWFPEYYTVYYEDVDLSLRLRSRGGVLVFCPSSRVNHYHTGTNREHSASFVENVARSSLLFAGRYGGAGTIARALAQRVGDARNELVHGHGRAAAAGTRGFLSALASLPRPLISRIRDQLTGAASAASLTALRRHPYLESR